MTEITLVRLKMSNGTYIDFHRDENNVVQVCNGDHCVILPKATGQQTLDLFALLESFGEIIETEEGDGAARERDPRVPGD